MRLLSWWDGDDDNEDDKESVLMVLVAGAERRGGQEERRVYLRLATYYISVGRCLAGRVGCVDGGVMVIVMVDDASFHQNGSTRGDIISKVLKVSYEQDCSVWSITQLENPND